MYLLEEQIDMTEVEFQTEKHQQLACIIGICNPRVTTLDQLTDIAKAVNKVPEERIKDVTYGELSEEFGLPYECWSMD